MIDSEPGMQPTSVNENTGSSTLQTRPKDWAHWLTLIVLLGTAAVLRLRCADCKPFWFDESFSVEVARLDWRNFLHLMWWREANMSLYYVLLRAWLHFGQSPFFIRSLSVVISVATIPAIYWVAKLLFNRRVALIASALLACNAYSIRYAQEARSYAFFMFLATLSSGFLIAWLRGTPPDLRSQFATSSSPAILRWGYIVATILAVYAHFYALLLVAVHWMVTRIFPLSGQQSTAPLFRRMWKIIGLAVFPLLIFVGKTGAGPIRWIPRPGLHDLGEFITYFAGGTNWILPAILVAASIVAVAPVGKEIWRRGETWEVWRYQLLLLWLLFPILLTLLLSIARPVFLGRYMIFCLPAFHILAAAGLSRLNRWALPPLLALVLVLGLQGTAFVYAHDFDNERDASGAAATFILDHSEPGDAIIFHIAETRIPYEFFRSVRARTNTASPDFAAPLGPRILFPRHGADLDYRDFTGKPTAEFVRAAALGHPRLWLMLMNNGSAEKPDPTTVMLSQILPESYPKIQRWPYPRVEVRLYSKE